MSEAWRYDLGLWVAQATRGLDEKVRKRLKSVAEARHREGYARFKQEGMTEITAQWRAIEALGRPQRAVKVFAQDDVALWLIVATEGLCEEAKERLAAEIGPHCEEACAAFREEGMGEYAAQRRAVEALGSPEAARRSFKRTYLTADEAALVENHSKLELGSVLTIFAGISFLLVIAGGPDLLGPIPAVPRLALHLLLSCLLCVVVLWVQWYVSKRKNAAIGFFVKVALLCAAVAGSVYLGWPLAKTVTGSLWFDRAYAALMVGYLVFWMAKALRMAPKLVWGEAVAARELGEKDYKDTKD